MSVTIVPKPRRRRRWLVLSLVAVLAVATIGVVVLTGFSKANGQSQMDPEKFDLRLGKIDKADIQVVVNEIGTIDPAVRVDVKSNLSGKITELLVREGDRVNSGTVLARVEPDVNQAQTLSEVQAELNRAGIRAKDAQRELERYDKLAREGYVSEFELKVRKVTFDTSQEDLKAARTRARIVEESGIPLDGQVSTTQRVNIVSPMDGFVIKKNVEVGQTVMSGVSSFNEGTTIYTVADINSMLIRAAVNEVDIGRVRQGMPVRISVDAFPFKHFNGKVSHISPAARLKDRVKVFDVEVTLDQQTPDFRSGMTANVEFLGEKVEKVVAVPVEAVFRHDGKEIVYVLKKTFDQPKPGERPLRTARDGKFDISDAWQRFFEERPLTIGLVGAEKVQVLSGLAVGDQLALEDPTKPRRVSEDN